MNPKIQKIISMIPAWEQAYSLTATPQRGGLTNANYLIEVDNEKYILRLSGANTSQLGIDRQREFDALKITSQAGIAPQIILFTLPEGHLVTRFIEGYEWGTEAFKEPEVIQRVSELMKRVHALPSIPGHFSPYRDIELRLENAQNRGVTMPDGMDNFLEKLYVIEKERLHKSLPCLCHNDPFHNNFIYNDRVYLLDWEFAGMGDIFFDLASVSYFFNASQKDYLLQCYFGKVTDAMRKSLTQLWYVVAFWNATWALLQIGNTHTDFNYAGMVKNVFAKMAEMV